MDNPATRKARERSHSTAQPQNRAHAAEDFIRAAADRIAGAHVAPDRIISVCAWCPELRVMKLSRQAGDQFVLMVSEQGKLETAYRKRGNAPVELLTISDTICDECRVKITNPLS